MKIDRQTYFKNLLETTSIHQKAWIAVTASEKDYQIHSIRPDPPKATVKLCCGKMQRNGRRRL